MLSASDIMTQGLIIIDPSAKSDAAKVTMMKESIDHLPVAETQADGKTIIKGIVMSNHLIQTLAPSESAGGEESGGLTPELAYRKKADNSDS